MRIGPSLILASRQTLAMTPQLQQAIKLLQFSHLELAAFIQQELEKNPLLQETAADDGPIAEQDAPADRRADRYRRGAGRRRAGAGRCRRALDARIRRPRRRRARKAAPREDAPEALDFVAERPRVAGGPCAGADRADLRRRRRSANRAEARRRPRRGGLLPSRGADVAEAVGVESRDRRTRLGAAAPDRAGRTVRPHAWRSAWARSSPSAIASIRR